MATPTPPNPPRPSTHGVTLRGILTEAELLPPTEGFPEGARATIVCGSSMVDLFGPAVVPLVGAPVGSPVEAIVEVIAERARINGHDRSRTLYRFKVRSVR